MNFKVGDKVRVRRDLDTSKDYGADRAVSEMVAMAGQVVTIGTVDTNTYTIEEDQTKWGWTDEMFYKTKVKSGVEKKDDDPNSVVKRTHILVTEGELSVQHTTNSKKGRVGLLKQGRVMGHVRFEEIDTYIKLLEQLKEETFKSTLVK